MSPLIRCSQVRSARMPAAHALGRIAACCYDGAMYLNNRLSCVNDLGWFLG